LYICVIRDSVLYSLCRDIVFLCSFPFILVKGSFFPLCCTTRLVNNVVYVLDEAFNLKFICTFVEPSLELSTTQLVSEVGLYIH